MATIKAKFRPSSLEGHDGSVYYQILHDRVPRQIATSYKVMPSEWDDKRGCVSVSKESNRKPRLFSIRECIKLDIERLNKIIRTLEDKGMAYSSEDVCEEFRSYKDKLSLCNYVGKAIMRLKLSRKKSTSCNYNNALKSFKNFLITRGEEDVMMDSITSELIGDYQTYLFSRGITRNTISFYMRQLRAVYNAAVDDGIIEQRNPFRKVYTGIDKTVKRAISLDALSKIVKLDLSEHHKLDFARDMFVLSYYFRGMSFVDMAYLKKTDIENGYLVYCRRKTGQPLKIRWTSEMQGILDKYPVNPTEYLLPIIKKGDIDDYYAYKNALAEVNKNLKQIGMLVNLPIKLTHYVARHTWASGALSHNIPIKLISEGMGHDNISTTQIYLASLDTSDMDAVNDKMIMSVR